MIKVDFVTDDKIEDTVEGFLDRYHANRTIPVPIEQLVEFDLGIEIRPTHGLRARFAVDGFLSRDGTIITVDEELMRKFPNRYAFTLGHELGHLDLHAEFIANCSFSDTEQWKGALMAIDSQSYSRMEAQAYRYAGYLLVPYPELHRQYTLVLMDTERRGVDLGVMGSIAPEYLSEMLAPSFGVSTSVIMRRLRETALMA